MVQKNDAKNSVKLDELAAKINASHQACLKALRSSLTHARQTGTYLIEAKSAVESWGARWIPWVQEHCKFSISEAQRYMRIADRYGELRAQCNDPDNLTMTEALKLLSPKKKQGTDEFATVMWASALFALAVVDLWCGRPYSSPSVADPPLQADRTADQPPVPTPLAVASPTPDEDFIRKVATLLPHDQVRAVADEMKRRNPGFDGLLKPVVRDGKNVGLSLSSLQVSDLSPLRALPDLETLDCSSPTDHQWGPLADRSPLAGMPLEVLDCSGNSIDSVEPLRGLPLHTLLCHINQIKDLSSLADLPLTTLNCGANPVEDWTTLARLPLRKLFVNYTSFHDFSVLKKARLEFVRCEHTRVTDLGPLAGMPLVYLDCGDCKVVDLEPLRKTPLRFLGIRGTEVSDLSPLARLRLEEVGLTVSKSRDLTPLKGMPIRVIELDFDPQRDGLILRSLPRVVQAVLVDLYQGRDRFVYDRSRGRFRDYLKKAVISRLSKLRREVRRAGTPTGQLPERWADELEQHWQEEYRRHVLREALTAVRGQVEPKTYQAFDLYTLQGVDAREVARFLGVSTAAVYTYKNRVLEKIRPLVQELMDQ